MNESHFGVCIKHFFHCFVGEEHRRICSKNNFLTSQSNKSGLRLHWKLISLQESNPLGSEEKFDFESAVVPKFDPIDWSIL